MQRITQIGIVSFAKIMAISGALATLIVSVIYGSLGILFSAVGGAAAEEGGAGIMALGIGMSLAMMFILPLIALVVYFVVGLIYGLILNLVLSLSGGLELRIESPKYPA